MKKITTQKLVLIGILIAMQIVLTRFLSIQTPFIRIDIGFLPIAIIGILFGPISGGISGAIADLIGVFLFPVGTPYFGFTLSAFLGGATYGTLLHKDDIPIWRTIIACCITCLVIGLFLNTFWLSQLLGKGFWAMFPARVTKEFAMLPIQVILITAAWAVVKKIVPKELRPAS